MEQFLTDHPTMSAFIIGGLFSVLGGLTSLLIFFIKGKIKQIDTKAKKNCTDITEIKENYIERFDEIKQDINTNHLEVTTELATIKSAQVAQKEFCKFIQDGKN